MRAYGDIVKSKKHAEQLYEWLSIVESEGIVPESFIFEYDSDMAKFLSSPRRR